MRIGIDARMTQGHFTGDATYWRGLINGLAQLDSGDEFLLYMDSRFPIPDLPKSKALVPRIIYAPTWRLWSILAFPMALKQDHVDLAHVQYTIAPWMPCRTVTTVHDVSFKRHPEYFKLKDRLILEKGMKRNIWKAARFLVVSQYTKKEIVELYGVSPERIDVVFPAISDRYKPIDRTEAQTFVKEKYGLESPFILTVGVIQPRKNLPRLLEGLSLLKQSQRLTTKLAIVGKYGWKEESLMQRINDLGLKDDVVFTGYAPDEDLPYLYSAAEMFVYPSVYEGFGLPPAESMACGTPVITGDKSSLPEVVDDAGLMVDPYDPSAFADAITKLLADDSLRTQFSAKGIERAELFSESVMAQGVVRVYHSI